MQNIYDFRTSPLNVKSRGLPELSDDVLETNSAVSMNYFFDNITQGEKPNCTKIWHDINTI